MSFSREETTQAVAALNFDLLNFNNLATGHSLLLNSEKSVVLLFGTTGDRQYFQTNFSDSIKINNSTLQIKSSAKNLGLLMDPDLRFTDHINLCLQKAYINLKLLFQHRHVLTRNLKSMLCNSLVLSHLNFCDAVYGPCITARVAGRIQKLQNSCIRLIFGIRKYDRISYAYRQSGWLMMGDRRYLHLLCLYHKILTNKSPPYLYNKIRFRTDVHNINIRFKGKLTMPAHNTALFERSFSYLIAKYANNLSETIMSTSVNLFKQNITNHLMARNH